MNPVLAVVMPVCAALPALPHNHPLVPHLSAHTKTPFSGGPELISAFFLRPQLIPFQLLQHLHRDDSALPDRWCWCILGALAVILGLLGGSGWRKCFSNQGLSPGTVPGRWGPGLRASPHVGIRETGFAFLIPLAYLEFSLPFVCNEIDTEATPNRDAKQITKGN